MSTQYPEFVSELLESIQTRNEGGAITDAEIFEAHLGGKLSVDPTAPLDTQRSLSIAYTPGLHSRIAASSNAWVSSPCRPSNDCMT